MGINGPEGNPWKIVKQSGNNLESERTNANEVGIGENKWESEVTRGTKEKTTGEDKIIAKNKGKYRKQVREKAGTTPERAMTTRAMMKQVGTT